MNRLVLSAFAAGVVALLLGISPAGAQAGDGPRPGGMPTGPSSEPSPSQDPSRESQPPDVSEQPEQPNSPGSGPSTDSSFSCRPVSIIEERIEAALVMPRDAISKEEAERTLEEVGFDITDVFRVGDEGLASHISELEGYSGPGKVVLEMDPPEEPSLRSKFISTTAVKVRLLPSNFDQEDARRILRELRNDILYTGTSASQLEELEPKAAGRDTTVIDVKDRLGGTTVPIEYLMVNGVLQTECAEMDLPIEITVPSSTSGTSNHYEVTAKVEGDAGALLRWNISPATSTPGAGNEPPVDEPQDVDDESERRRGDSDAASEADDGGFPLWGLGVLAVGAAGSGVLWARRRGTDEGSPLPPTAAGAPPYPGSGPFPGGTVPPGAGMGVVPPVPAPEPKRSRAVDGPIIDPIPVLPPAPGWTALVPGDANVRLSDVGLMRLTPVDSPSGRSWSHATTTAMMAAGWLEKKPRQGEDAEPTMRSHESGRGLIAVYDGTGGSGSGAARRLRDGTELSGAYVASRLTREMLETWYTGAVERDRPVADPDRVAGLLSAALRDEAETLPRSDVVMRGRLNRVLPTTLAAIAYQRSGSEHQPTVQADVLWAGDSRAFVLSPRNGLQALSTDDSRESDALKLIRNDQPMDNLVSADREFQVNHHGVELGEPLVFLVATDGCFGYVRTPAHFEYLLLEEMRTSADLASWSRATIEALGSFTGDDASFAMVACGFESFETMKEAFSDRAAYMSTEHWTPFIEADDDRARIEELREESWAVYRDLYQARMPSRSS